MKLSAVKDVRIPNGIVKNIKIGSKEVWSAYKARYVSLGDSIAAGHTIDDAWATTYGEDSQYGKNGNNVTAIVPNCYTDLIRKELESIYGGKVGATSFARSGDTVVDLMEKLNHDAVKSEIAKADLVTICIGANDVLQPAMSHVDEYINTGDLSTLAAIVEANLATLNNDAAANSYKALFDKLAGNNSKAKFVFTTIYNPYKYLWLDEGQNGFFSPLLNTIPAIEIFGLRIDSYIKDGLLGTSIVRMLFDRVNGLCNWAEKYVTLLNNVLRAKIAAYGSANFLLADTKAVYDAIPDRPISAPKHYNDLVSVEYTRGYNTATMDWGRLWSGSSAYDFWWNLATKYTSLSGIDIGGFATELVQLMIDRVIVPDVDPHPEYFGHYALEKSFADALGWDKLQRRTITFNANGGTGSMAAQTVVALDNMTAYTNINQNAFAAAAVGYYWNGWTDASGAAYTNGQLVGLTGDLALTAQWSNIYVINLHHSEDSTLHGSGDTGPMECYAFWIDGVEQADLGAFSNPARAYRLPYGTSLGVIAQTKSGAARSYITVNDVKVAGNSDDARWGFTLTSHMDIHFQWNYWLDGVSPQSYWNCYITTY